MPPFRLENFTNKILGNRFENLDFPVEITQIEYKNLEYFFGKKGINELKAFIKSDEDLLSVNGFNDDRIHILNEMDCIDEPTDKEKIEIQNAKILLAFLKKNRLNITYYDSGSGPDSFLFIEKN